MTIRAAPVERSQVILQLPAAADAVHLARAFVRSVIRFDSDDDETGYAIALTETFVDAVDRHARHGVVDGVTIRIDLDSPPAVSIIGSRFDDEPARGEPSTGHLRISRSFVPELTVHHTPTTRLVDLPLPRGACVVPT